MTVYIVATVVFIKKSIFFGDVILITTDKAHAKTMTYTLKEHRPLPNLDYNILTPFDDVIYFERKMNDFTIDSFYKAFKSLEPKVKDIDKRLKNLKKEK